MWVSCYWWIDRCLRLVFDIDVVSIPVFSGLYQWNLHQFLFIISEKVGSLLLAWFSSRRIILNTWVSMQQGTNSQATSWWFWQTYFLGDKGYCQLVFEFSSTFVGSFLLKNQIRWISGVISNWLLSTVLSLSSTMKQGFRFTDIPLYHWLADV